MAARGGRNRPGAGLRAAARLGGGMRAVEQKWREVNGTVEGPGGVRGLFGLVVADRGHGRRRGQLVVDSSVEDWTC